MESNIEDVLSPEFVKKVVGWGFNLDRLKSHDSKTLENIKRDTSTKLFFHLSRAAHIREAKQRGLDLEKVLPGTVLVFQEEDDDGKQRQYHCICCKSDSYLTNKLQLRVWFPIRANQNGEHHSVHISEVVKAESTIVEMNQHGTSPTDEAKAKFYKQWETELL